MGFRTIITETDTKDAIEFINDQISNGYIDFNEGDGDYRNGMAVAIVQLALAEYKSRHTLGEIVDRLVMEKNYNKVSEITRIKVKPCEI